MSFKTLKIAHQPDDSYAVTVDGTTEIMPNLRELNEFIARIDPTPVQGVGEIDEENIL